MGYPGARICTVLIYLRAPQAGGETEFPNIGLTVPIGMYSFVTGSFVAQVCVYVQKQAML